MMYRTPTRKFPNIAMLRVLGATMLALVLLLGVPSSASAQSVCASHAEVLKQLGSAYSEAQIAIGLAPSGRASREVRLSFVCQRIPKAKTK